MRIRPTQYIVTSFLFLLCIGASRVPAIERSALSVAVDHSKVEQGQEVRITINSDNGERSLHAVLLRPSLGIVALALERVNQNTFQSVFRVPENSPNGLYGIHVFDGDENDPRSVTKASFRVGNIVADYLIANYVDKEKPAADLDRYLADFSSVGGNFLVAHNLIIRSGAFYPSKIAATNVKERGAPNDLVELILDRADKRGFAVLLSVSWDITRDTAYGGRMNEIKAITSELHKLYSRHPSLVGFYSWQEGSGTYYAPFVREFSVYVKSIDRGLLTACAPHIDDPLLAGYLSVVDDLDIMIYQSAVMASYRPDNRKKYPPRRVRDFSSLGTGAKRLQNKIVLTHVELFAYMEKLQSKDFVTAPPSDIKDQILSAAAATDSDGIALFTYHAQIYDPLKKYSQVQASKEAVADSLKAFKSITSSVTNTRNPFALYIPYSDFIVERWTNYFLPALDSFRRLGVPVDILPYAPRFDESIYPYYPIHHNPDVLERLLKERTILVLANVSGFQQTDSDMIKEFIERGGTVIAFGGLIPMGRTFDRRELFGGEDIGVMPHRVLTVKDAIGPRVTRGKMLRFPPAMLPSWRSGSARVIAAFEDGSAAVFENKYNKGTVVTIVPDAAFAVAGFPDLVRDVFDHVLRVTGRTLSVDVLGADEDIDTAIRPMAKGFDAAVVNHHPNRRRITLRSSKTKFNCVTGNGRDSTLTSRSDSTLSITVSPHSFDLLRCSIQ